MRIITFSSPLQYLFASLINKQNNDELVGYYYQFHADFSTVFDEIDKILESKLTRYPIENIYNLDRIPSEIILSNRFSYEDIKIFEFFKQDKVKFSIYEEGTSFYIDHNYLNKNINDKNIIIKLKNLIKKLINKPSSHIYMKDIDKTYSIFGNPEWMSKKIEQELFCNEFNKLKNKNKMNTKGNAIILSQWFVEHNILKEEEYIDFIGSVVNTLKNKYSIIYYKAHPRDNENMTQAIINKYSLSILAEPYNILPVEIFIGKYDVDTYGFWTSAMFYVHRLWDIPTFSLFNKIISIHDKNIKLKEIYTTSKYLLNRYEIPQL